jgi:hypothetical protein
MSLEDDPSLEREAIEYASFGQNGWMCAGPTQPSRILRLSFSAKPVNRFRVKLDGDVNHSRRETCKPLTTDETEADVADHQRVVPAQKPPNTISPTQLSPEQGLSPGNRASPCSPMTSRYQACVRWVESYSGLAKSVRFDDFNSLTLRGPSNGYCGLPDQRNTPRRWLNSMLSHHGT